MGVRYLSNTMRQTTVIPGSVIGGQNKVSRETGGQVLLQPHRLLMTFFQNSLQLTRASSEGRAREESWRDKRIGRVVPLEG